MKDKLLRLEKEYHIQDQTMYKDERQEAYLAGLRYAIYLLKKK